MENNQFNQQPNNQQQNYQQPIYNNVAPQQPLKESGLGIASLIMCVTGCLSCLGVILAIVDVCKKDNTKKHTCSKIALIVFGVYMVLGIIIGATNKGDTTTSSTKTQVEETVKEETDQKEEKKEEPNKEEVKEPEEVKEEPKEEKSTYSLGETVNQNDVEVTLVSVTESKGSEYLKPDDGNVFLICEFQIENNSSKDITVSSMLSFEAYCDDYSINQDFVASTTDEAKGKNQLDGDIKSGKKMNGIINYQVPEDWNELEINYTPDFWAGKEITFVATK